MDALSHTHAPCYALTRLLSLFICYLDTCVFWQCRQTIYKIMTCNTFIHSWFISRKIEYISPIRIYMRLVCLRTMIQFVLISLSLFERRRLHRLVTVPNSFAMEIVSRNNVFLIEDNTWHIIERLSSCALEWSFRRTLGWVDKVGSGWR